MRVYNKKIIEKLPLSSKEKFNDNRNRKGFHVYLSRFFIDFNKLSEEEKLQFVASTLPTTVSLTYAPELEDDDVSWDSTDTPLQVCH